MQKCFIRERSIIARLAAWKLGASSVAIVIGRTIHLHNSSSQNFLANKRWVRHELTHIEQFRHYGSLKFICLYLAESLKNGYYNNRFEVEARNAESNLEIETRYQFVNKDKPPAWSQSFWRKTETRSTEKKQRRKPRHSLSHSECFKTLLTLHSCHS